MSIVFNGRALAKQQEQTLLSKLKGKHPQVKSFTFSEDEASVLYTHLKQAVAKRLGIVYEPVIRSTRDNPLGLVQEIQAVSLDPGITGVMIQKPIKDIFQSQVPQVDFEPWWSQLVTSINPRKDIDCLTPSNLTAVKAGNPKILPATVKAVLAILEDAKTQLSVSPQAWKQKTVAVIGRSDIVGKPLYWVLREQHEKVELFGRDNLPLDLSTFDIIISATGTSGLISGDMIAPDVIAIDVGSPKGDFEYETTVKKAAFLTPVPGGVGPMTVISLMDTIVSLASRHDL